MREVAQLLSESNLEEISLEGTTGANPARLTVRRSAPVTYFAAPQQEAAAEVAPEVAAEEAEVSAPQNSTVGAPAVGVFRSAKPALNVGDSVKKKQLLGFVEALKIPNEVYATEAGTLVEILATDGQGVEWGAPLFVVEPAERR